MPGHFIVKWKCHPTQGEGDILIDPFDAGKILTLHDCKERVQKIYDSPVVWRGQYLARATNHDIIARMLRNLKANYMSRADTDRAISVIQKILIVAPDSSEDVRDLGLVHLQRRELQPAFGCLERYLRLAPRAHDCENVREIIRTIRGQVAQWN